jgi:hypothetical protein
VKLYYNSNEKLIQRYDMNCDGKLDFSEFLPPDDTWERPILIANVSCVEYFFLKDGLTAKVVCPKVSRDQMKIYQDACYSHSSKEPTLNFKENSFCCY